jgi:hypothetical protein
MDEDSSTAVDAATQETAGPDGREPGRLARAMVCGTWTAATGGPTLYVLGRMVTDRFYGRFGVLPEDVGLTYASLLVPTAMLTILAAAVAVVLAAAGRFAYEAGWGVLILLLGWFVFSEHRAADVRTALFIAAAYALLHPIGRIQEKSRRGAVVATLVLVVMAGLASRAWVVAGHLADDATSGRPVALHVGPFRVTGVRATPVRIAGLRGAAIPAATRCFMLLGSSGGVTVVLDRGVAWRLPSDAVSFSTYGCAAGDALLRARDLAPGWQLTGRQDVRLDTASALLIHGVLPCGDKPPSTGTRWTQISFYRGKTDPVAVQGVTTSRGAATVRPAAVAEQLGTCRRGWTAPYGNPSRGRVERFSALKRVDVALPVPGVVWQAHITVDDPSTGASNFSWVSATLSRGGFISTMSVAGLAGDHSKNAMAFILAAAHRLDEATRAID